MLNIIEKLKESFASDDISLISKTSKYFARIVTKELMDKNYGEVEELCLESSRLRDWVDLELDLKRDNNYYLGYIYAYENIARRLSEEGIRENDVDIVVAEYPKAREALMFLGKNQFATQGEIASALNISPSHLWNILSKNAVSEANIFVDKKIGRSKIYSLSERGREYYDNACNPKSKIYSKADVKDIISFVSSNKAVLDIKVLLEKVNILDEELLYLIYNLYIEHLDICIDFDETDDLVEIMEDVEMNNIETDETKEDLFEILALDEEHEDAIPAAA